MLLVWTDADQCFSFSLWIVQLCYYYYYYTHSYFLSCLWLQGLTSTNVVRASARIIPKFRLSSLTSRNNGRVGLHFKPGVAASS